MRRKWVLVAGAVLALVVVGGIGGLTMRALAGVVHSTEKAKTVTRLCVYVDQRDGGASYGDLSTRAIYGHKTCIVGKRGPAGNSSVVTWNKTVATPGSPPAARHKAGGISPSYVDLAQVGPFTIRGYCETGEGVAAVTDVLSGQDGSSFAWDDSEYAGNFNSGLDVPASNFANGTQQSAGFATEYDNGEFSVSTADQTTAFSGFATNGVYIQGADGPACSFTGYVVLEK